MSERVLVAGNPFAFLRITSDQPGGLVGLHLFDIGPEFRCRDGFASDARRLSTGVADLRFHAGNLRGRDFPVGSATDVRVDLTNLAAVLEPGHRLGLSVSHGDYLERAGQPYAPNITVHAEASHVVVPVAGGSGFGGAPPTLDYPPRPFLPPG